MDNCNGHGTHVAGKYNDLHFKHECVEKLTPSNGIGIIGAHDPESGFVGVAPDGTNFFLDVV